MQQQQTYAVTGGAGAIGSNLVCRLLGDGAERVIVLDDLSSGFEWLLPRDSRLAFVECDVSRHDALPVIPQGAVVFHLAALFANQNSVDHPDRDLEVNGRGTLNALQWAARNGASRFVYASAGCSIAGHGVEDAIREDMPVSLHLDTPYQITKALGEFYCNYFDATRGLSTIACRFFNSYGPGEVPGAYRNVIPNFVWAALHNDPLVITGTGEETRDFIFVDDLVDGLVNAARCAHRAVAVNLGTSRQTRIIDLAECILRVAGSASRIEYASRRSWDKSVRRCADAARARDLLGFAAGTAVEEGVAQTVAWFQQNEEMITRSIDRRLTTSS